MLETFRLVNPAKVLKEMAEADQTIIIAENGKTAICRPGAHVLMVVVVPEGRNFHDMTEDERMTLIEDLFTT